MKLDALNFDSPNNACLSLRTLAEWVRTGEIVINTGRAENEQRPHDRILLMTALELGPEPRKR